MDGKVKNEVFGESFVPVGTLLTKRRYLDVEIIATEEI